MKNIINISIAVFILLCVSYASSRTLDRIAVIVNDRAITVSELADEMIKRAPDDIKDKSRQAILKKDGLRKQTIDEMITDIIVKEEITKRGLEVSDSSLEMFIRNMMQQNRLSTKEELISALALQNLTLEEYKENLRKQIERTKIMNYAVRSNINVSDYDLKNYYMQNLDEARAPDAMHLKNIYIAKNGKGSSLKRAEAALKKLKAGTKFETVARKYSDDSNAKSGGDLGFLTVKDLNPKIISKLSPLKISEHTDIIKTAGGYYIFKLIEKKKGKVREFEEVKEELRKKLVSEQTERKFKEWLSSVRSKSFIDIKI